MPSQGAPRVRSPMTSLGSSTLHAPLASDDRTTPPMRIRVSGVRASGHDTSSRGGSATNAAPPITSPNPTFPQNFRFTASRQLTQPPSAPAMRSRAPSELATIATIRPSAKAGNFVSSTSGVRRLEATSPCPAENWTPSTSNARNEASVVREDGRCDGLARRRLGLASSAMAPSCTRRVPVPSTVHGGAGTSERSGPKSPPEGPARMAHVGHLPRATAHGFRARSRRGTAGCGQGCLVGEVTSGNGGQHRR